VSYRQQILHAIIAVSSCDLEMTAFEVQHHWGSHQGGPSMILLSFYITSHHRTLNYLSSLRGLICSQVHPLTASIYETIHSVNRYILTAHDVLRTHPVVARFVVLKPGALTVSVGTPLGYVA
jgi:hypothetical protein